MTKKIFAMFLAVLMVVSVLPTSAFAAEADGKTAWCAGHGKAHCVPVYPDNVDNIYDKIPEVKSTNYQVLGEFEATCEEDGGLWAQCNVCGDKFLMVKTADKNSTNDKGYHNWVSVEKIDATCVDNGQLAYSYCDICGLVKYTKDNKTQYIEINNEDSTKSGMTQVEGKWQLTGYAEGVLVIKKGRHNWTNTSGNTCVTGGTFTPICSICGAEGDERDLNNLGQHQPDSVTYADGRKTVKCTLCFEVLDVVEDPDDYRCDHKVNGNGIPTGKAIVYVTATNPTHHETGVLEHYYCAACGTYWIWGIKGFDAFSYYEGVNIEDCYEYDWTDEVCVLDKNGKAVYEETYLEPVMKTVTAEDTIIPVVDHVYTNAIANLTCESTSLRCDICEAAADQATFEAALAKKQWKGHSFASNVWGCDAADTQKCENCDQEFTAAQVGGENDVHHYDEHPLNGYVQCTDEYRYCLSCKKDIKQDPALLGVHEFSKNPCLNKDAKCSYCGKTSEELGIYTDGKHHTEWIINTAANCTTAAIATEKCTVCGQVIQDKVYYGDPAGHNWEEMVVPGTCFTPAYTYYCCTNANCPLIPTELNKNNGLSYAVIEAGEQVGLSYTQNGQTYYLYAVTMKDVVYTGATETRFVFATSATNAEANQNVCFDLYENYGAYELVKTEKAMLTVATNDDGNFVLKYGNTQIALGHMKINLNGDKEFAFFTNGTNKLYGAEGNVFYVNGQSLSNKATANFPELELYILRKIDLNEKNYVVGKTDKENHAYVHTKVSSEATCVGNRFEGGYCEGCGDWVVTPVEIKDTALGHDYYKVDKNNNYIYDNNGDKILNVTRKDPTCVEEGSLTYECWVCGYKKVEKLTLAEGDDGHKFTIPEAEHGSANNILTGTAVCENEGCEARKSYVVEWEDKEGWTFDEANAAHQNGLLKYYGETGTATCTTAGVVEDMQCTICNRVVSWTVPALGHEIETVAVGGELKNRILSDDENSANYYYKAPTCQTTGYDYTWECTREGCNESHIVRDEDGRIVDYKFLDKIPCHFVETDEFKEAVKNLAEGKVLSYADNKNLVWKTCEWCDNSVKAFEYVSSKTNANLCTASNYEVYITYYGDVLIYNRIGKLGHLYFFGGTITAATCTTVGKHTEKCYWCGEPKVVEDAKIPHRNNEGRYFTDSCQDTETNRYCEDCGKLIGKSCNMETHFVPATCGTPAYYYTVCCNLGCDCKGENVYIGDAYHHEPSAADAKKKPVANWDADQEWTYKCIHCKENITETVAQKTGIHLVTDATEYTYGSLITVTVRMDNVKASLAGYQFTMSFDNSKLALVGFENIDNHNFVSAIDLKAANTAGVVNITGTHAEKGNYTFDGSDVELLTLYFRVKSNDKITDEISYTDAKFVDAAGKDVKNVSNVTSDTTKFVQRELGDFNGIVGLTIHDVTAALEMITYGTTKTYDVAMDVNFDGTFDGEDVRILMELLSVSDGDDRAAAMKALVCEAMGEEHAELCFGLKHCTNCNNKAYYDSTYCPTCGKALN